MLLDITTNTGVYIRVLLPENMREGMFECVAAVETPNSTFLVS